MNIDELLKLSKNELKGKLICFPTDTVYGVGCMIDDEEALKKIYHIKHRELNKPLAVLFPDIDSVLEYGKLPSKNVKTLMEKYWPGALTLIMEKKQNISNYVTAGKNTIGCRIPNSNIALKVLKHLGPMATTSINLSGMPPLNDLIEIKTEFKTDIDYYIDDLEVGSKISSTVIDVTKNPYVILREGSIKIN